MTGIDDEVEAFVRHQEFQSTPRKLLLIGSGYIALGICGIAVVNFFEFGLAARAVPNVFFFLGVLRMGNGFSALRRPIRVLVDTLGLIIEYPVGGQSFHWDELAHVEISNRGALADCYVVLRDEQGGKVARLTGELKDFQRLVTRIIREANAARQPTAAA